MLSLGGPRFNKLYIKKDEKYVFDKVPKDLKNFKIFVNFQPQDL